MQFSYKWIIVENDMASGEYVTLYDEETMQIELPTTAFLFALKDNGAPSTTLSNFADTLKHFLNEVYAKPSLRSWNKIQKPQMDQYIESRALELKDTSFNSNISRLRQFFEWAYKTGWLDQPAIFKWKPNNENMRRKKEQELESSRHSTSDPFNLWHQYITPAEFECFLGFNPRKSTFLRERDEIILKLGYLSGWRRSETVNPVNIGLDRIKRAIRDAARIGHDGFELQIIGKGKDGGKVRTVYIPPSLKNQIVSFIDGPLKRHAPRTDLLICKTVNGKAEQLNKKHATNLFSSTLHKVLSEGELDETREWRRNEKSRSFHSLRHSYATNEATIIRINNDSMKLLQQRLGHRYAETTEIYLHFEAVKAGDLKRAERYDPSSTRNRREFDDDED